MTPHRTDPLLAENNRLRAHNAALQAAVDRASTEASGLRWAVNEYQSLLRHLGESHSSWQIAEASIAGMREGGRFCFGNRDHFSYRPAEAAET